MSERDDLMFRQLGITPPGQLAVIFKGGEVDVVEDHPAASREYSIAGTVSLDLRGVTSMAQARAEQWRLFDKMNALDRLR